jgi:hypothetical protein
MILENLNIFFLFQSGKAEDTIRQLRNELSMSKEKYSQVSHDVCIIVKNIELSYKKGSLHLKYLL